MGTLDPSTALIGRRVREIRRAKGWTQIRVAAESGLQRSTIAGIEAGHQDPSAEALFALARALQVPPQFLVMDPHASAYDAHYVADHPATYAPTRKHPQPPRTKRGRR